MRSIWAKVKGGAWLTPERLRVYCGLLLSLQAAAILALVLTSDGRHDLFGRPLGTDFAQVWVAGGEVLRGHPEQPYDLPAHLAEQRAFFGSATDVYGWHYPPYFLALAALLALLPYATALAISQISTLPLYLAGICAALRNSGLSKRDMLIAAGAFPAVFVNLTHGQNGLLTAGLFAVALIYLERRPWVAGLLFALLAYKPQFGIVIPVALIAGGHWRALRSGAVSLIALTALSVSGFGLQTWLAFQHSLGLTRRVVLEEGNIGWEKIQSVFSAVRMLGGTVAEAYALQTIVSASVVAAIAWLWYARADRRLKYAALLAGALLVTPYSLDYDMVLLGPALAFTIAYGLENGFAPFEKTLLAAIWLMPLLARIVSKLSYIPIGSIMMIAFFIVVIWRGGKELFALKGQVFPLTRRPAS